MTECGTALRKFVRHHHFHRYSSLGQSDIGIPASGSCPVPWSRISPFLPSYGIRHEFLLLLKTNFHIFSSHPSPRMMLNGVKWTKDDLGVKSTYRSSINIILYRQSSGKGEARRSPQKSRSGQDEILTGVPLSGTELSTEVPPPLCYRTEYRIASARHRTKRLSISLHSLEWP